MNRALAVANRFAPFLMGEYVGWKMTRPFRYDRPAWERALLEKSKIHGLPSGRKFWSWGDSGPFVLLVHGWEGRGTQLGSFVDPLVARGFRVLAWDGPAHGASSGMTTHLKHFSEALGEDSAAFREEIFAVIAHSMGGPATLLAMEAAKLRPQKISLIAAPSQFTSTIDLVAIRHGLTPATKSFLVKSLERRFRCGIEELDFGTRVWRPRVPVQVVHDASDKVVPIREAHRLAELLSSKDLKTFNGLGHRSILKSRDVVQCVLEFISMT
ncbi:MAG: alpha/beta fold hydrolase [Bdellovibrionota bacterium]